MENKNTKVDLKLVQNPYTELSGRYLKIWKNFDYVNIKSLEKNMQHFLDLTLKQSIKNDVSY